jgi:hypothetical protein
LTREYKVKIGTRKPLPVSYDGGPKELRRSLRDSGFKGKIEITTPTGRKPKETRRTTEGLIDFSSLEIPKIEDIGF